MNFSDLMIFIAGFASGMLLMLVVIWMKVRWEERQGEKSPPPVKHEGGQ